MKAKLALVRTEDITSTTSVTYPDNIGFLCMDMETKVVSVIKDRSTANLHNKVVVTINKDGEVFEVVK